MRRGLFLFVYLGWKGAGRAPFDPKSIQNPCFLCFLLDGEAVGLKSVQLSSMPGPGGGLCPGMSDIGRSDPPRDREAGARVEGKNYQIQDGSANGGQACARACVRAHACEYLRLV